jgi:excisionase family DNA binding protein
MIEEDKHFLSITEFAILLRIHPNTVRRSIKNGRISAFKVGSGKRGTYRISKDEINRIALFDLEELIEKIIEKRDKRRNISD